MSGDLFHPSPHRHLYAMHDPRTPEILEWIARLPPRDRLATMMALRSVFPMIDRDKGWKAEIGRLIEARKMTGKQIENATVRSIEIAKRLREEMGG